jgi:hypothetical protein
MPALRQHEDCIDPKARKYFTEVASPLGVAAMRDFVLLLAPVALAIYFVIYPHQFAAFLAWLST